ncbi:MAG TPA: LysR substrate-binding domain-containing protein [bacterium]|nr:LysR substrate-binding domain-containing protein [bacterium]
MESGELRMFEAVARLGSLTRAAHELHTVQSNVTARVRRLEDELRTPLFRRHSRGVALTPAGEQLLPVAVTVRHLLDEAAAAVGGNGGPRGRLRIGSLETTAALRLPPILTRYRRRFPDVDLALITRTTAELIDDVLAYRLAGAFVAGPVQHPDLVETTVWTEELVLVTSSEWRSLREIVSPAREINIVVLKKGCSYRERLERFLAERGVVTVRQLEFGTVDGVISCAGAGLGVTLMPRAIAERARRTGDIALHRLPRDRAFVPTVFVHRRDAVMTAALARFMECAMRQNRRGPRGSPKRPNRTILPPRRPPGRTVERAS